MRILKTLILLTILLVSCSPTVKPLPSAAQTATFTPTPTVAATATAEPTTLPTVSSTPESTAAIPNLDAPLPTDDNPPGFTEAVPETWVKFMPAVREYFYYRKQAIVSGNVAVLWKRYPALKQGSDSSAGINSEEHIVNMFSQSFKRLLDGNIVPEAYERIKVKLSGADAEVLVHGGEQYLYRDETGKFDDTGSEFKIILFLRSEGSQWTLYKTADITPP